MINGQENYLNTLIQKCKDFENSLSPDYRKKTGSYFTGFEMAKTMVSDLIDAFNNLLKRKELDRPIATKITKKELSVTEKVNKIKNILRNKKKINFEDIFEVSTKEEVIISFLSVLEMVKKDEILLTQEGNFKNIVISLKEGE